MPHRPSFQSVDCLFRDRDVRQIRKYWALRVTNNRIFLDSAGPFRWDCSVQKTCRIVVPGISVLTLLFWVPVAAPCQSAHPRILYSDLESGPNLGGQNNGGAFVTLYGRGF